MSLLECGIKGDFLQLDLDVLQASISSKTKAILLNTPHNPTGFVLPIESVTALVEASQRFGCYIVFDEVYRQIVWKSNENKTLSSFYDLCLNLTDRVIGVGSISKVCGTPGLRIGWLISNQPSFLKEVLAFKDYCSYSISKINDMLGLLALKNIEHILDKWKTVIPNNLKTLNEIAADCEVFDSIPKPMAGCVCFPRVRGDCQVDELCKILAEHHSVFVLPGSTFGESQHIRLNLARKEHIFNEALDLIVTTVKNFTS